MEATLLTEWKCKSRVVLIGASIGATLKSLVQHVTLFQGNLLLSL